MAVRSKRPSARKNVEHVMVMLEEDTMPGFDIMEAEYENAAESGVEKLGIVTTLNQDRKMDLAGRYEELENRRCHLEEQEAQEKGKLAKAQKSISREEKKSANSLRQLENVQKSVTETDKNLAEQESLIEPLVEDLERMELAYGKPDNLLWDTFFQQQMQKKIFLNACTGVHFGAVKELQRGITESTGEDTLTTSSTGEDTLTASSTRSSEDRSQICGYVVSRNDNLTEKKVRYFSFSRDNHSSHFILSEIWKLVREVNQ